MVSSHDHLVYVEGADARRLLRTALEGCSAVGVATDWEAFVHEFANVRSAAVCLLDLNGHSAEGFDDYDPNARSSLLPS